MAETLLAVDWGTSNRRAYLIGAGRVLQQHADDRGILSVAPGGWGAAVEELRAAFEGVEPRLTLMAGMVGSNRGWVEAPYVPCPAGMDTLVKGLVWAGEREAIVPGVCFVEAGRSDVMRGEEVQLLGAAADGLIDRTALVCHPGTHNKWALVRRGQIDNFRTVMTGELFSLLKEHSILADLLSGEVSANDAFRNGVQQGLDDAALPAELFSIRARVLLGRAEKEDAASYASGLLIGTDVRIGLSYPTAARVVVMGRPELTQLYAAAIAVARRETVELDGERCFLAGAKKIAEMIE